MTSEYFNLGYILIAMGALSILAAVISFFTKKTNQYHENLNFALESGHMGTWDINLEKHTISCSKEMLDLWNIDENKLNGNRAVLQDRVHPDDLDQMNAAINLAIKEGTIYEHEFRIIPRPDDLRWVKSRGRCIHHPGTKNPLRFAGVVYDITESKSKEAELARAIKMRDQFFMIATHELKTPLTCMQLQIQVGQWDLDNHFPEQFSEQKLRQHLKKQQQHLLRITRIIDNIIDESKITEDRLSLQREHFELNEMISEVLERFKVTAQASEVEVHFTPASEIQGHWDCFRLEQVFINLLINAIRYGNKKPIHIEVKQENDNAYIVVRDTGRGIKQEDQSRIFNRFERAIDDISGIGLGLFISKNIVEAHAGEIYLKSEFGKGSEFTVALPLQ